MASKAASRSAVAQPGRLAAGVDDQIGLGLRRFGQGKTGTERGRDARARGVRVHHLHAALGQARREPGHQQAKRAPAHHGDVLAWVGLAVPQGVDGGFQVRGQHGARGGHPGGQRHQHGRGHLEHRLVRIEAEHLAPEQLGRPGFDHTHVHVTVFHRAGEIARLERRAHALRLAGGHLAPEHQALGAPAHAGVQGAHAGEAFGKRWQGFVADLGEAGADHPASLGGNGGGRIGGDGHGRRAERGVGGVGVV
ncbi:hypothetical protein ACFJGX_16665 [Hydrogenophaga sp. UC242_50]|uniref:hypothetical protein n=1 Tax=Hydrogenophaga sp. UC242_50 TaxID=3350169 RepID=UPI0036D210F6